jgi:hypothetical protein
MLRVWCWRCKNFDIAETVANWLDGDAKARQRARLVADASRREAKLGGRLRIESAIEFVIIATEEERLQAGDWSIP